MIRYWSSKTKNTERFVQSIGLPYERIPIAPESPCVIICPTYGDGECPKPVVEYVRSHRSLITGCIAGGNRNFGSSYAGAGKVLRDEFGIKTLYTFELAGNELDVERCRKGIVNWLKSM